MACERVSSGAMASERGARSLREITLLKMTLRPNRRQLLYYLLWCLWWQVCNPSALALSLRRPPSGSMGHRATQLRQPLTLSFLLPSRVLLVPSIYGYGCGYQPQRTSSARAPNREKTTSTRPIIVHTMVCLFGAGCRRARSARPRLGSQHVDGWIRVCVSSREA